MTSAPPPEGGPAAESRRQSLLYLTGWLLSAAVSGLAGVLLLQGFRFILDILDGFILSRPSVPLPAWPLLGALLAGGLIYRWEPRATGEGMPSYIEALQRNRGRFPLRVTLNKLLAALFTLSFWGSGGLVGPLGRVNAGLMSWATGLADHRSHRDEHIRTAAICGLAAVTGAVFHSPVGGGIFAVEIIQRANMRYRDLFPAILSSTSAVFFARLFRTEAVVAFAPPQGHPLLHGRIIPAVIAVTLCSGLLARAFIGSYAGISRLFGREQNRRILPKVLAGSLGAALIAALLHPGIFGTSQPLFQAIAGTDPAAFYGRLPSLLPLPAVILLLILAKGASSSLTIGSGLSAGFTGPSFLLGALLGAAGAALTGLPAGSSEYYTLVAAGCAGMLSSTMNVPIAAAIITIEVFGLWYSLPAGLAAVVGFQINRHNTIYDTILAEWSRSCEDTPPPKPNPSHHKPKP